MFVNQQLVLPGILVVDQAHEQPDSSYEDVTAQTQIHHSPDDGLPHPLCPSRHFGDLSSEPRREANHNIFDTQGG